MHPDDDYSDSPLVFEIARIRAMVGGDTDDMKPSTEIDEAPSHGFDEGYRDNPLLVEIKSLKKQMEQNEKNWNFDRNSLEEQLRTSRHDNQYLRDQMNNRVRAFTRFFLYGVFLPTWFAMWVACVVLPIVMIMRARDTYWLWLEAPGLILAIVQGRYLHRLAEPGKAS